MSGVKKACFCHPILAPSIFTCRRSSAKVLVSINTLNLKVCSLKFFVFFVISVASIVTLICTTAVKCHPATSASSKDRSIRFPFKTDTTAQPPRAELLYCRRCGSLTASTSNFYCGPKKNQLSGLRGAGIFLVHCWVLCYCIYFWLCEQNSWAYRHSPCWGSSNHKNSLW